MSTRVRGSFALVVISIFAFGCGDGGGGGEKASEKCDAFVATYCDRFVECAMAEDLLDADFTAQELRSECEEYMQGNARCDTAVRVSKSFGQCVDDVQGLSCGDLAATLQGASSLGERYTSDLPSTCEGAVLYTE
jgi:hypothetical protein